MPAKWISFKPEVRLTPAGAALAAKLLAIAADCAPELHGEVLVVTSANDSKHKDDSQHYASAAWDMRTHPNDDGSARPGAIVVSQTLSADERAKAIDAQATRWAKRIQKRMGAPYQVIYEAAKMHVHAEVDYGEG